MGAIGDYVHLTARNYERYGATLRSRDAYNWSSGKAVVENVMQKRQLATIAKQRQASLKQLQRELNLIFGKPEAGSTQANIQSQVHQVVQKLMQDKFGESLQTINWDTGDVVINKGSSLKDFVSQFSKNDRSNPGHPRIQPAELKSKINQLNTVMQNMKNIHKKEQMQTKIKSLITDVENLYKRSWEDLDQRGYKPRYSKDIQKKETGLVNQVNSIIADYAAYPAINLQKGQLFEYAVAVLPYIMKGVALTTITEQLLSATKIGGKGSSVIIDAQNFNTLDGDVTISLPGGVKKMISSSQGKTDVIIEWAGQNLNASLKNINLGKAQYPRIHILDGSSLLYLLQGTDTNFVNHFLNIYAQHHNIFKKGSDGYKEEMAARKRVESYRAEIGLQMKTVLLYKALTGDTFQRQAADIFIVNDSSSGRIKVYDMYIVIKKFLDNPDLLKYQASVQLNGKNIVSTSAHFKNLRDANDASGRISTLIGDLHTYKVKASLPGGIID